MYSEKKYTALKNRLIEIYSRVTPPVSEDYLKVLEKANSSLLSEDEEIRPYDSSGVPGGIVYLKKYIPAIIVPDIHARMDFIMSVLFDKNPDEETNLQRIASDKLQIVCIGDGVHAERRAAARWNQAYKEFESDYKIHDNIDEEMKESLGAMEMIMELKANYPGNFHFLKGNHENIKNEDGGGNYSFMKFSYEGPMASYYVKKFYGTEFLEQYSRFEKNLPVFAVGRNFLVSHSEPWSFYEREKILEYRNNPDVIEGLTWTADDAAIDGSVQQMLDYYIEDTEDRKKSCYFGGHRPVKDLYNSRAGGRYIQIHNPDKFIVARIGLGDIDLEKDITELENKTEEIIREHHLVEQ